MLRLARIIAVLSMAATLVACDKEQPTTPPPESASASETGTTTDTPPNGEAPATTEAPPPAPAAPPGNYRLPASANLCSAFGFRDLRSTYGPMQTVHWPTTPPRTYRCEATLGRGQEPDVTFAAEAEIGGTPEEMADVFAGIQTAHAALGTLTPIEGLGQASYWVDDPTAGHRVVVHDGNLVLGVVLTLLDGSTVGGDVHDMLVETVRGALEALRVPA